MRAFELALAADTAAIGAARSRFAAWLAEHDLDGDAVAELVVVFSELTANAVHAAGPDTTEDIGIRAELAGDDMLLEVENAPSDDSFSLDVFGQLDDPLREHGRGLMIVAAFVDDLEILAPSGSGGLLVRCRRRLVPARA